ncbi:MAG: hypothetical protein IPH07_21350 [Deltaproteobacteria bacterium]|nr:hypothetical protein [Deltaproteobacteria bacterium]MBK8714488.1 hypothetical protein [Deltaproteobacteria bacterium]MBP7288247.1 hypothetical protein [Nannocystaceae bacterium]
MSTALWILLVLAPLGAIDVVYYHLYRFALYARPASVAEQITHLVRQACFLAVVALLAMGTPGPIARVALVVLLAVDLVDSAVDVLLEPRSRAALGGLPPFEYFLHFVGTFGSGLASAAYLLEYGKPFAAAPVWMVAPTLILGAALLGLESALFVRARLGCCASECRGLA